MNLQKEIEKMKNEGYSENNAEARLCQDIILKAISESSLNRMSQSKVGCNEKFVKECEKSDSRY